MNNIYRQSDIGNKVKLVITHVNGLAFEASNIQSAMNAVDYAAKKCLRIDRSAVVTGEGSVLGNVMILDLNIPLEHSNSRNWKEHEYEFRREVQEYMENGVYHKTSGQYFGDFGSVLTVWVTPNPTRTVTLETTLTNEEILARLGDATLV